MLVCIYYTICSIYVYGFGRMDLVLRVRCSVLSLFSSLSWWISRIAFFFLLIRNSISVSNEARSNFSCYKTNKSKINHAEDEWILKLRVQFIDFSSRFQSLAHQRAKFTKNASVFHDWNDKKKHVKEKRATQMERSSIRVCNCLCYERSEKSAIEIGFFFSLHHKNKISMKNWCLIPNPSPKSM